MALALATLQTPAMALDYVWLGGSGNWNDASKWSLLGVPGSGDSATLNGSSHSALLTSDVSLGRLILTNGFLGGTAVLNAGSASFGSAVLGWSTSAAEGTLNVSGATSFAGASINTLRYGQILNLNGDTTWSAGNGRIEVGASYAGNSSTAAHRSSQINIASGATFTDLGAAAAGGTKTLGYDGGQINNAGTYVRNGLGTTVASYGFNNTGTVQINAGTFKLDGNSALRSQSSGLINVASGAVLGLGDADITGGTLTNNGRVLMNSSSVATVGAAATIGGAWELNHGNAQLQLDGTHSIGALTLTSGYLGGTAVLNATSASFGSAVLGWSTSAAEGTLNVSGATSFAGASINTLRYGQVLNLNGDTTWSAGNGRIEVGASYAGNSSTAAHRSSQINIASGATFTDLGAAAAGGTKTLGYDGGQINNAGTYVRNGLGTTVASYGFNNTGTVQVNAGTFKLDGNSALRSQSSGLINVASGAVLGLGDADITNGTLTNNGRVLMNSSSVATVGAAATIGGAWELSHGNAQLQLDGTHSIGTLTLTSGYLGGTAVLNATSASFGSAVLGWSTSAAEGTLNVSGATSFAGASINTLRYGQVLNLNGDTTWSAGNGRIEVGASYAGNSSTAAHRSSQINIASGATFTDLGAAAAGGTKTLGYDGGQINNAGSYVRNGLGTTVASYGFNNTGTVQINAGTFKLDGNSALRSQSSGLINVASGAVLGLGDADITGGTLTNNGRVLMNSSSVATVSAAATIGGAWELNHGNAQLQLDGTHSIGTLTLTSGYLGGTAVLNATSASFGSAVLGWSTSAAEGTLNVSGATSFAGASINTLRYGQVLNLNGDTTWSAGNGRIEVGASYAGNSSTAAHRSSQINIASGATFTDLGAAAAGGTKTLGYDGGQINNAGTYVRNGLGTTVASYGFDNSGTVQVNAGTFAADDRFVNTGEVAIAAGATLRAVDVTLRNAGIISGTGTVQARTLNDALTNSGTLAPGSAGTPIGTLSITGDLSNADTAIFSVDLGAGGTADLLAISDDVLWNGTLSVHATPGLALNVGDSFVVATFDERLSNSVFDTVTWHGASGTQFSVEYNAHDVTLRVTAAVPEPATYALWLLGLAGLGVWRSRKHRGPHDKV